ncbi:sce7726 family protein [Delftia acidovorans]|uniref:sce7726 family protein n=1 Tax=Delftia acidovorans TaxID=80866 RepID=UPI0039EF4278
MARSGVISSVIDGFAKLGFGPLTGNRTVSDLFEAGFEEVGRYYRCEYYYKAAIANRIVYGRHSPRTSSLAIELNVHDSIVDAVVFNGTSTAYEIKTEFDSPVRLTTQTPAYLRAFDKVNVVTDPRSGERYMRTLDPRVGVIVLNRNNSFSILRPPLADVARIEPSVVFRMLRRHEYMKVIGAHFGPQPDLPNGMVDAHYRKLFSALTSHQAHEALISAMRARTTCDGFVSYLCELPSSLRALGYATPLSAPQRARVLACLSSPL